MQYPIFTTKYDEVIRPLDLTTPEELEQLAERFHLLCPIEDFEPLREKLANIRVPDQDTVVTLLIDNSGSMRGTKMSFAVGATGIISMYLDRLGIRNEILGFTTKTWNGGEAFEDYRYAVVRPANPGRVDCLRHIVYKETSEQLQDVRNNLALMFKEGLLKENIDGEAVLWACERLRSYNTKRRILLVISDGAPIANKTLGIRHAQALILDPKADINEANKFLSDHLVHVITELNEAGDIELDAIGIGVNVSNYYGVGTQVDKLEELAPTAIDKLITLLKGKDSA